MDDMTAQARTLGGRYQVGELLGYGGMAEVHRGRDLRLGRDVAIKTLRHDLARDDTFQLRFRREAQNAASLNHPAIVAVYDTGEEHGPSGEELPYIVMEFVNGRTLKEVLTAEGRLMPRRALELTADVCAALEFSHRHGIIHRDIKPGNVMLTQTGQVKVMDFGIARALASGASTMTQTSAVIGTAQYLSPEQARGEAVDARSDVYATGCLLYELLCGHPPFVGDNPVSVAYQHVREDPRAPSESNRDVTPDVDSVVLKALAKNPLNRYQSAGEMRADLLRAAAGRPVIATPVMNEHDRTMIAAPPAARVAGPGTRQAGRYTPPPRRTNTGLVVALTLLGLLAVAALGTGLYLANRTPTTVVPTLVGKTKDEARAALADKHLRPQEDAQSNPSCPKGKVFGQDPPAGRQVQESTVVTYQLCLGPGQTKVPQLTGLTKAQAITALKDAKLTGQFTDVDSTGAPGTVVGVTPPEGSAIDVGKSVAVQISKGNQKQLPSVVTLSEADARAQLAAAGFTHVQVVDNNNATADQIGKVTGQDPAGNTTQKTDTTIRIFVGRAQKPSSPPSGSGSVSPGG
jgi:beta-lactam-binding protein with PASTA domain/predicted Ser/Thr protein kinase